MSTGKTKKLELSQWVYSDPFRMEEMNENFRKIDEAVEKAADEARKIAEAGGITKLIDLTLTQNQSTVELDFSEIDLTDLIELHVYFPYKKGAYFNVNDFTGTMYYTNSTGNWQEMGSDCNANCSHLSITGTQGPGCTEGNLYFFGVRGYYVPVASSGKLQKLTFIFKSSSSTFSAGERFVVLGVRA